MSKAEGLKNAHRKVIEAIKGEEERIDSRWRDDERKKARAAIRDKYADRLNKLTRDIEEHRQELAVIRQAESDPMLAMFRRGFNEAGEVSVGFQGLLNSLDLLDTNSILTLVGEHNNPALVAKAWQIVKSRDDVEGDRWKSAEQQLLKAAHKFLNGDRIKAAARDELILVREQLNQMETLNAHPDPTKKLSLGREAQELEKVLTSDPRQAPIPRQFDATEEED